MVTGKGEKTSLNGTEPLLPVCDDAECDCGWSSHTTAQLSDQTANASKLGQDSRALCLSFCTLLVSIPALIGA